jgi:3-phosphoshikimate 1-carboxyvinyltransferase
LGAKEVSVNQEKGIIHIQGPILANQSIKPSVIEIDGSQTTQFYSALSLALAFHPIRVIIKNLRNEKVLPSQRYGELTTFLISLFQKGQRTFSIPLDFSSLSYPLVLAAHRGSCLIRSYNGLDPWQIDSRLVPLLKEIGCYVEERNQELYVDSRQKLLTPFEWDVSLAPDLFPALCFLSAFIPGTSTFKQTEILQYKESHRLQAMTHILDQCGISYHWDTPTGIFKIMGQTWEQTLQRRSSLDSQKTLQTTFDHRMVMTGYLFLRSLAGGFLSPVQAVSKSFPSFFSFMGEEYAVCNGETHISQT